MVVIISYNYITRHWLFFLKINLVNIHIYLFIYLFIFLIYVFYMVI